MYIILEFQTNEQGLTAMPPAIMHTNSQSAESAFYSICASAALSDVYEHTAIFMDSAGEVYQTKTFKHGVHEEEELV